MGKDNHGTIASVREDLNELIWGTPFLYNGKRHWIRVPLPKPTKGKAEKCKQSNHVVLQATKKSLACGELVTGG
jgi:hypothetical protein